MITKEEMQTLLSHFEVVAVPSELEKFVEKIKLILEEIEINEESKEKLKSVHEKMQQLSEDKEA